ncbi:Glutathione transport system permease protein GsiC [subsurface metagenome]
MRFIRFPGGMYGFILRRLLLLIPIFFAVTIVVFMLLQLTGDPARQVLIARGQMDISAEQLEDIRHQYGFHRPVHIQYIRWLTGYPPPDPNQGENAEVISTGLLRGDLGVSHKRAEPVTNLMKEALPNTLILMGAAFMVSLAMGLWLGIIAALRRKTWVDYTGMGTALFGVSIPNFWQGLMAILIFGVWLKWFPLGGYYGLIFLVLPALTLGTAQAGSLARMTRSSMLDVLMQDYIRTARAKGLRERAVIYTHALKNALIPIVTLLFLRIPYLFGGTVVIEVVFKWPGMGTLLVKHGMGAAGGIGKDWAIIQGGVLMFLVLAVLANLICDIAYAYLNPKIRYGEGG